MTITIEALTADRWSDLCQLFGPNGANSGCWCMWWRVAAKDWSDTDNRAAFEEVARSGSEPGLLAYIDDAPAGWCAVAPRAAYPRLLRSPALRPADPQETGVWSVTCFFINRHHRRAGLGGALLTAAVDHAKSQGATAVEGYPVETRGDRRPSGDLFTGTVRLFAGVGFSEHIRPPTGKRIVMRLALPS